MKTKTKYTEEPMGHLRVVKDFLPPPDKLVLKEDNVKVTISLKKSSISLFQRSSKSTEDFLPENDQRSSGLVRLTLSKERITLR